nr:MAG TPA: immunity protein [Caudoviricetes sp.]
MNDNQLVKRIYFNPETGTTVEATSAQEAALRFDNMIKETFEEAEPVEAESDTDDNSNTEAK